MIFAAEVVTTVDSEYGHMVSYGQIAELCFQKSIVAREVDVKVAVFHYDIPAVLREKAAIRGVDGPVYQDLQ